MSWLTGKDLVQKIQRNGDPLTQACFHSVSAMDTLPHAIPHYPFLMIVNTDTHNLPGTHWLAVYIDERRHGEIFDSLALPTSLPLAKWMNQFTTSWRRNGRAYQHPLSSYCGAFVLYFVLQRLFRLDMDDVTTTFRASLHDNECRVRAFFDALQ